MRYHALRNDFRKLAKRKEVVKKLKKLKSDIAKEVPGKILNENIIIATWNIRDFDSNKFGNGPRMKESFFYIAEVISAFDVVAIQEVNEDLYAFNKLMYVLGEDWDFIMTDVTEGSSGNGERMAYVFNTNRVRFEKIAGEIVLPDRSLVGDEKQFARTPYMVAFKSGWFNFKLCTVHIYFGAESGAKLQRRIDEIESIAKALSKKAKKSDENLIVLGDFNISSPDHKTMQALEKNGFKIPDSIKKKPRATNMFQTKYYDQIAYNDRSKSIEFADNENSAGVYNFFDKVFSTRQFKDYQQEIIDLYETKLSRKNEELLTETDSEKLKKISKDRKALMKFLQDESAQKEFYKKKWRTFQMSDHLPMWTELKINFSTKYLDSLISIE